MLLNCFINDASASEIHSLLASSFLSSTHKHAPGCAGSDFIVYYGIKNRSTECISSLQRFFLNLLAQRFFPPIRWRLEAVEEVPVVNGNVTVAARPASFSMVTWCQRAPFFVQRKETVTLAFAFPQFHMQFLYYFGFILCTFFAYQFRFVMMFKVVKHKGVKFFTSQLLLTSLACVRLHILRITSFFTASFVYQ